MFKAHVQPRSVYEHHVFVQKPFSTINWNFSTEENSLCFGLFFKPFVDPLKDTATSSSYVESSLSNKGRSAPKVSRANSTTTTQTSSSKSKWTSITSYTSESDMELKKTNSWVPSSYQNSRKYSEDNTSSSVHSNRKKSLTPSIDLIEMEFIELIPVRRVNCSKEVVRGSFAAETPGYYVLLFDNRFSVSKKKSLYLEVTSDDPNFRGSDSTPELSGWLQRKGRNILNAWEKQWFEFYPSGVLRFYSKPGGAIIGSIQVLFCAVSTFPSKRSINVDSGTTYLYLRVRSDDDFDRWTSCFKTRCALGMGESDIQSAKSIFEDMDENKSIRQDSVLKALGEMDMELETLRGLVHQTLAKETEFSNKSQSLESAYRFSTSNSSTTKRNLSFKRSSTTESIQIAPNLSSPNLKQFLEKMLVSISRIDLHKESIYSDYMTQRPQQSSYEISENTETGILCQRNKIMLPNRISTQLDEFYDAEEVSSSSEPVTPESSNNYNNEKHQNTHQSPSANLATTSSTINEVNKTAITRRRILPHPSMEVNISVLDLLRKNIGKDLMTISLPVTINEPLGALQRQCEELEYSSLIDKASEQRPSMDRLMYIAAFAISGYASSQFRISRKPFNPVLAETYECVRPDKGFIFIAEKVSHHPNVMACFAESKNFQFRQTVTGRSKFWGKSLEWIPEGSNHVTLLKHNEHYSYTKPSSWVRNIVAGTRYLDHVGDMKVMNHSTGEYAIVTFMESTGGGLFGIAKDKNHIVAKFFDNSDNFCFKVTGKWSESLVRASGTNQHETIWKVNPPALSNYKDYFGFTQYCMELNEITELERGKLPKTDTRYRTDQRFFEQGQLKEAEAEKNRIEQTQRERRKKFDTEMKHWSPLWFEKGVDGADPTGESWYYKGGYWEARSNGQWPGPSFDLW